MQPSIFNTHVPLPGRNDVFIINTFTDAQLIVSADVAGLLDRLKASADVLESFNVEEQTTLNELAEHGFVVKDRETEREALEKFFTDVQEDTTELRVTVLTTLQCNFACDYCLQGDHGDYNKTAEKMSMEDAARVCDWVETRFEENRPEKFSLMFFGGEPLLNLPVLYYVAERLWGASQRRGIEMVSSVVTNGLLLTPEVVDRLLPYGLNGFKVTLDGDQETHDRMRPLRGGQGTFDKIIANIRRVADRCSIAIGGVLPPLLGGYGLLDPRRVVRQRDQPRLEAGLVTRRGVDVAELVVGGDGTAAGADRDEAAVVAITPGADGVVGGPHFVTSRVPAAVDVTRCLCRFGGEAGTGEQRTVDADRVGVLSMDLAGSHVDPVDRLEAGLLGLLAQEVGLVVQELAGVAGRAGAAARERHTGPPSGFPPASTAVSGMSPVAETAGWGLVRMIGLKATFTNESAKSCSLKNWSSAG